MTRGRLPACWLHTRGDRPWSGIKIHADDMRSGGRCYLKGAGALVAPMCSLPLQFRADSAVPTVIQRPCMTSIATLPAQSASVQAAKVPKHGRNELAHGGMNVHRACDHRVRRARVHDVEKRVYDLVPVQTQNRGAEDFTAVWRYQHFHEPLTLSTFNRAFDAAHRKGANQCRTPGSPDLGFCHPHPA